MEIDRSWSQRGDAAKLILLRKRNLCDIAVLITVNILLNFSKQGILLNEEYYYYQYTVYRHKTLNYPLILSITNADYFVGVNTCQPCKAFFCRSLFADKVIKPCRFKGKCAEKPNGKISCRQCRHRKCLAVGMHKEGNVIKEIIDSTGTETFAKEPKLAKLLWEINCCDRCSWHLCSAIKKFTGFSRETVTQNLLCFWYFVSG